MLSKQVIKPKGPPKELERLNTQNNLTTKATITGNKITVITTDVMIRPKQKLIVVIDVSDSMNVKVKSGNDKSNRVSVLHLVKHCIKTLISSLNDDDELALITYSAYAHTIRDLTQMTIENKRIMSSLVDSMIAGGKTNLYDGLKHAFNITERESGSVLLFNGGVPNVHPRNGELEELRLYRIIAIVVNYISQLYIHLDLVMNLIINCFMIFQLWDRVCFVIFHAGQCWVLYLYMLLVIYYQFMDIMLN